MDKYIKTEKVGYGGYGDVYKGYSSETKKFVTLKELWFREEKGVPGNIIREISLLKELQHRNVIRLLDVVDAGNEDRVYLVYESLDSDLTKLMAASPETLKDPDLRKIFVQQILHGISFYHSHKVYHGDLDPQNVLVDVRNKVLKLADFAWARVFGGSFKTFNKQQDVLPRSYKAPELHFPCKKYSTSVDVWSVGCIFAELVMQQPLFPAPTEFHQLCKIFSIMGTPNEETWPGITTLYPTINSFNKIKPKNLAGIVLGLEPTGLDLLSKMLCLYPSGRITAKEALNHAYFDSIRV